MRQERLELLVELGCQRLVVREHQSRLLKLLDHVGRRKRLAGPRRPEQDLAILPGAKTVGELGNCSRLIAGRLKRADDLE